MDFLADLEARGLIQDSTDRDALRARIQAGPVGVYYGCDPSADSLHVGNLIGLLVLRRFADAGHNAIALAGGATGMIGDPGGRSKERNLLDTPTLARNTKRIADQLERISRVALVNNLDWTESVTLLDFLRDIGKHASVNQMIARESVKTRLESENGISFTEFSYQLLQANDYLHLSRKHDVELQIGGSDQWGNLLAGVDLIRQGRRQARARVHLAAAAALGRQEVRQVRGRRGLAGRRPDLPLPVLPVLDERRGRRHRALPAAVDPAAGRGGPPGRGRARRGAASAGRTAPPGPGGHHAGARGRGDGGGRGGERDLVRRLPGGCVRAGA